MRDKTYTSEAIVLAQRNYSESDRILVLFTRRFGKMSYIAKGVRKPKSRKRGLLQPFNEVKISASRSHGLDIIFEVESINDYSKLKKNLKKVTVAYFLVETIGRILPEEEKNEQVYILLQDYFNLLSRTKNLRQLRDSFTKDIVKALGFWPKDRDLTNPDLFLENLLEKKLNSIRVGKRILE